MPYVPSKKTDGKSDDREVLDLAVEKVAKFAAGGIENNFSLIAVYKNVFFELVQILKNLPNGNKYQLSKAITLKSMVVVLGKEIHMVAEKYGYEGAFLGEHNDHALKSYCL